MKPDSLAAVAKEFDRVQSLLDRRVNEGKGNQVIEFVANGPIDPNTLVNEGEAIVEGSTLFTAEEEKIARLVKITDQLRDLYKTYVPSQFHSELGV